MILALDIGNTNIVIGCIDSDKILFESRLSTDKNKTAAEYAVLLKNIFEIYNISLTEITGAIMSSVVPPMDKIIKTAIHTVTGYMPIEVNSSLKHGIKMNTDNPAQVGNDILVSLVATLSNHKPPLIIFDLGTASTIAVVDKDGTFIGMAIMPGIKISQDALIDHTSQLPAVSYEAPPNVIGANTVDCIKSGIIFGNASMIDGMISRIEEELGQKATVIATGGLADAIIPYCKSSIILDDSLMLKGLKILYDINK